MFTRHALRELLVVAVTVATVIAAIVWLTGQPDENDLQIRAVMLDDTDIAALEPALALGYDAEEIVDAPVPPWVPDSVSRVPSLTLGWSDSESDRKLILIGYLTELPTLTAEIYDGHVATVSRGALEEISIGAGDPSYGQIVAPDGVDAPARDYRGSFHRGRLFVDVWLTSPEADEHRELATLRRVVSAGLDKAPDDSAGTALPGGRTFAVRATGIALGLLGVYLGLTVLAAWWRDPLRGDGKPLAIDAREAVAARNEPVMLDVTEGADRDRRASRRRTAALLLGASITVPALMPLSWPVGLALLPVGVALTLFGFRHPTKHNSPGAIRSEAAPIRARLYEVIAVALLGLGLVLVILVGVGVIVTSLRYADNIRLLAAGATFIAAGGALTRFAKRLATSAADEVRKRDRRDPVLFLRAFADDSLRILAARSSRPGLASRLDPRGFDRFEELIAKSLSERGPVLAVSPPGTELAPLGAARELLGPGDWQPQVKDRIGASGWIAVGAAPSIEAAGFAWEIATINDLQRWSAVVLIVPPVPADELERRWSSFSAVVDQACGGNANLPATVGDALVIRGSPTEGWTLFTAARRDEWTYRAALMRATQSTPDPSADYIDAREETTDVGRT